MGTRKLTVVDICEVTGYNRYQLRGLLDKLPQFAERAVLPRVAREFTPQDMVVLSVLFILENRIGINRANTTSIAVLLSKALSGPKEIDKNARLFISFDPLSVRYGVNGAIERDGVVVSLGSIFERVDRYFMLGIAFQQANLTLGPTLIAKEVKKSVA